MTSFSSFLPLGLLSSNQSLVKISITQLNFLNKTAVAFFESVDVNPPHCPLDLNWINTPGWWCELKCAWFLSHLWFIAAPLSMKWHYGALPDGWSLWTSARGERSPIWSVLIKPSIDSANLTVLSNTLWDSAIT